jgi:hypothetical protein
MEEFLDLEKQHLGNVHRGFNKIMKSGALGEPTPWSYA